MQITNNQKILTPEQARTNKIVGKVFILFGIILIFIGGSKYTLNFLYQNHSEEVSGVVTNSTLGGGRRTYYEFTTKERGEKINGQETRRNDERGSSVQIQYISFFPHFNRMTGVYRCEMPFYLSVLIVGIFFLLIGIKAKKS